MDLKGWNKKIMPKLEKYKFAALIVVVGIVLMLIPGKENKTEMKGEISQSSVPVTSSVQEELSQLLSCIQGAGKVKIMLKEQVGEERVYQVNEDKTVSESGTSQKIQVVTVADSERNETGLITKIIPPTYMGAVVLCQGGDDPGVKLAVAEAVSKITGLGMDRIVVLKMK